MSYPKYVVFTDVIRNETPIFEENTMHLIRNLAYSFMNAFHNKSKIDPETSDGMEILSLEGMTGIKTRHLYNNILGWFGNVKYLEIGTWYGSSSISALYKNTDISSALFIDNWSQFNGNVDIFYNTMNKFKNKNDIISNFKILESDCWKVDLSNIKESEFFNVYLYDGGHTELDHYMSLAYYLPVLEDTFVFIVDDWNWPDVRDGTMRAIKEFNLDIKFRHDIFVSPEDNLGMPKTNLSKKTWWNGCCVFLLSKTFTNRINT